MKKRILLALLGLLTFPVIGRATVTSQTISVSFACTGSVGPFPFTFPISDPTSMTVTQNGVVLSPTSYTISPVNNNYENGGKIILNAACPYPQTLVLTRITNLTQQTSFYNNMPAPMPSTMYGLDKLTEIIQELYFNGASKLNTNGPPNYVWGMNSGGTGQLWIPQTGGGGGGGIPYPGGGIPCSNGTSWCTSYSSGNPIPLTSIAPFGTVNLSDWTNVGIANGYVPIWNSITGKWTPGPQTGGGGGNSPTVVTTTNPSVRSGGVTGYDAIPVVTPTCDIRSQGAVINGTTPIDGAVQACIALINSKYGATGTVFLPCVQQNTTGAGCYLANSAALTGPVAGTVKFVIQGAIQGGSTIIAAGWSSWFGDGGTVPGQFQTGTVPATLLGPLCTGTLGTAITSANVATNITPTFSGNVYGGGPVCNISNFPVGSAITLAALGSSTATAVRVTDAAVGYSKVTLTLASALRIPAGENVTVTGCSDSSVNVANIPVSGSDYTAQTLVYFVTTTGNTTATGCTVTGFNEDEFESARVLCSNGVGGTFGGIPYNSCGAGQLTIMTKHTHLSTDQYGEVAAGPEFNTFGSQTWSDLSIEQCAGACFWAEDSTNLTMNNIFTQAWPYLTSVATELSGTYFSNLTGSSYFEANLYGADGNGGHGQPSNPNALLCDSDSAAGNVYSHLDAGCDRVTIDNLWTDGDVKLTGDGVTEVTGMPFIRDLHAEEAWGSIVSIDNRNSIGAPNCLYLLDANTQDNISLLTQPLIGYTDGNFAPTGCVQTNFATLYGNPLNNQYFNGNISDNQSIGAARVFPPNGSASSGVYNEGNLLAGEIENEGAGFSPQVIPYATLPFLYYSPSSWNAQCSTNCTAAAVVGPDGPNGRMVAAEIDTSMTGASIIIGEQNFSTYPGDHFIIGSWVRPGLNNVLTAGLIGGTMGPGNSFYIWTGSSDTFTPTAGNGNTVNNCSPSQFATGLLSNGWSPQVAICTIATGYSTSHAIAFSLTVTNGGSGTKGNQYAEPFWAFIPGPNNPACTAAGTCNLTADQIEEARRDQYHGFVPPDLAAGTAVTGEQVVAPSFKALGGTAALYRCSGGTSDGAILVSGSTLATTCTTGGGSLVILGITTL